MTLSIEQIENQISELQQTLDKLKNAKLEIARQFSGHYFQPYNGILYRRMESEGVPIWESYLDLKKEWVVLNKKQSKDMEQSYLNDCVETE